MTRTTLTFAEALTFSRACTADYVDVAGATITAAVDEPRFDHDPTTHAVLGLLVAGRPEQASPDLVSLAPPDGDFLPAVAPARYTILHQYLDASLAVRRVAHFTDAPRAAFDACLGFKARHQLPLLFAYAPVAWPDGGSGAVAAAELTFSEAGDAVLYNGQTWNIPGGRVTADGAVRSTSAGATRILEEQT